MRKLLVALESKMTQLWVGPMSKFTILRKAAVARAYLEVGIRQHEDK